MAVAAVAGDVGMDVVAEVAAEVVVAVDGEEAMAAITRTITTTTLAIQTMTAMSMKRTPTTEPMVQAANQQKPLPQIQVQSLIVPMGQPPIFEAARTGLVSEIEASNQSQTTTTTTTTIKNIIANNNNNQKYQLKIDKQRWIIPIKSHENSLMVDIFARLATETCFCFVQVQACNRNVFPFPYSYPMSISLIGHTLSCMRDKRSRFRNKVGYLNGEEQKECTTTQHFFTTNLDTIN